MPLIDPNKNPVGLTRRLEGETNPRYRRMLEEVRFHIAVEAGGDIDSAIARMAPNPEYIIYDVNKPAVRVRGAADIRQHFYLALFDTIAPQLEWDIVLCMVDGSAVITEGEQKNAVRGTTLIDAGFEADPEGFYLQEAHHLVVWPFDEQLRSLGEIVYLGSQTPLSEVVRRPLRLEDIGNYTGPRYDIA